MSTRLLLACLVGGLAFASFPDVSGLGPSMAQPSEAHARVSIAYTLEELVDQSGWAVVGTATERHSVWERVAGARRIVTYTRITLDDSVYGAKLGNVIWVRSLGGVVGKIGQSVAGEPQMQTGKRSLMFLTQVGNGTLVVSGAAQGHFPVRLPAPKDDKPDGNAAKETAKQPLLKLSPQMGKIIRRKGPNVTVQETLAGVTLEKAIAKIRTTKAARDALKKKR